MVIKKRLISDVQEKLLPTGGTDLVASFSALDLSVSKLPRFAGGGETINSASSMMRATERRSLNVDSRSVSSAKQLAEINKVEQKPSQLSAKWGEALNDGFVQIPVALLRHQKALSLSNGELVVLMNLLAAWWGTDRRPFLQTAAIAKRMDSDIRSVQRHMSALEQKGFIRRERSKEHRNSEHSAGVIYDLSGTVEILKEYGKIGYRARTQGEK